MTTQTPTVHAFGDIQVATQFNLVYPLTWCCAASGKGGEHGVICRACHQPVDPMFGDCAVLVDAAAVDIIQTWTDAPRADIQALVDVWRGR